MDKDCDCDNGYVWVRYKNSIKTTFKGEEFIKETWYDGIRFCPVCDPERAHIQNTSTSSEELGQRLRELSHYKSAENYDKQEASKTRIL